MTHNHGSFNSKVVLANIKAQKDAVKENARKCAVAQANNKGVAVKGVYNRDELKKLGLIK